jgi:hypothetical protein
MISPQPHVSLTRSALLAASRAVIIPWSAVPFALLSGGVMMAAGYLLSTVGWGTAGLMTIPGGVLILVAFRLAGRRQPTRRDGTALRPGGVAQPPR